MLGGGRMVAPVLMAAKEMKRTMSVHFLQGVWFDFWTRRKFVESRGLWEDVPVPALDGVLIWVREEAMICYAKEGRQRTRNEAGEVMKVELYSKKSPEGDADRWECGDGEGSKVAVMRNGQGHWACDRGSQGAVLQFDD
jgi:alpha-glucosidase (family GH31 glycosyl hydrolase)